MDSIKLAAFLFTRVENTIAHKEYISSVTISFDYSESWGNEYIRISYVADFNDKYNELSSQEKETLVNTFTGSPYYIFSLITYANKYSRNQILSRILEFKSVYLSLTSYVTVQLEKHLISDVALNIKGIDYWPQLNYAEKYFTRLHDLYGNYERINNSYFETDIGQYNSLHELSINSRSEYRKQKKFFKVTDRDLARLNFLELYSIRSILISHKVPIKITGIKTIDEIHINVLAYINALKKEIRNNENFYSDDYKQNQLSELRGLIEYLYDNYFVKERKEVVEQQKLEFKKKLPIQKGNILQLKDGRLVLTETIVIDENDEIKVKYYVLKTNLEKSTRSRFVNLDQVSFYLKEAAFNDHLENVPKKRISLLKRWMEKRKRKVTIFSFVPDLTQ